MSETSQNCPQFASQPNMYITYQQDWQLEALGKVKLLDLHNYHRKVIAVPCSLLLREPQQRIGIYQASLVNLQIDIKHQNFLGAIAHDNSGALFANCYYFDFLELSLDQLLTVRRQNNQRFPETDLLRISKEVLSCLAYLQINYNIQVGYIETNSLFHDKIDNCIKLYDTHLIHGDNYILKHVSNQSTPSYCTPEAMYAIKYKDINILNSIKFQSDIFSFGLTLLELATFQPSSTLSDLSQQKILTSEIDTRLQSLRSLYSPGVENLIRKMLTIDPRSRPSAQVLLLELEPPPQRQMNFSPMNVARAKNITFADLSPHSVSPEERTPQSRSVSPQGIQSTLAFATNTQQIKQEMPVAAQKTGPQSIQDSKNQYYFAKLGIKKQEQQPLTEALTPNSNSRIPKNIVFINNRIDQHNRSHSIKSICQINTPTQIISHSPNRILPSNSSFINIKTSSVSPIRIQKPNYIPQSIINPILTPQNTGNASQKQIIQTTYQIKDPSLQQKCPRIYQPKASELIENSSNNSFDCINKTPSIPQQQQIYGYMQPLSQLQPKVRTITPPRLVSASPSPKLSPSSSFILPKKNPIIPVCIQNPEFGTKNNFKLSQQICLIQKPVANTSSVKNNIQQQIQIKYPQVISENHQASNATNTFTKVISSKQLKQNKENAFDKFHRPLSQNQFEMASPQADQLRYNSTLSQPFFMEKTISRQVSPLRQVPVKTITIIQPAQINQRNRSISQLITRPQIINNQSLLENKSSNYFNLNDRMHGMYPYIQSPTQVGGGPLLQQRQLHKEMQSQLVGVNLPEQEIKIEDMPSVIQEESDQSILSYSQVQPKQIAITLNKPEAKLFQSPEIEYPVNKDESKCIFEHQLQSQNYQKEYTSIQIQNKRYDQEQLEEEKAQASPANSLTNGSNSDYMKEEQEVDEHQNSLKKQILDISQLDQRLEVILQKNQELNFIP